MINEVEKLWGKEDWIVNNDLYCGKILHLNEGFQGSVHYHKIKHETFFVLEGKIMLEVNNCTKILKAGDTQVIEPGVKHRFTPIVNSKIIEFSTKHMDEDTYRDTESGKVDVSKLKEIMND